MPKALRKAIMHSSKLKNIYNKCRTEDNCWNYKKQTHFCVNLLRKTRAEYFQKPNVKDLPDHKNFRKIMKPYFSNKGLSSNKLMLKKKKPTYCRGKGVSRCNDTFFVNITKGLDIKKDNDSSLNSISYQNIKDVIEKIKNHFSVCKIRQMFRTD